jgi:hypothetical protein
MQLEPINCFSLIFQELNNQILACADTVAANDSKVLPHPFDIIHSAIILTQHSRFSDARASCRHGGHHPHADLESHRYSCLSLLPMLCPFTFSICNRFSVPLYDISTFIFYYTDANRAESSEIAQKLQASTLQPIPACSMRSIFLPDYLLFQIIYSS